MQDCLRSLVERYLSLFLFDNACFLCERLYAEDPNVDNLDLLANCYLKAGRTHEAYQVLKNATTSRYLFAQCCFKLNKLREAEGALLGDNPSLRLAGPKPHLLSLFAEPNSIPMGAAGLYLLGLICLRENRREHAGDYFVCALKMDCFLWEAYKELCELGREMEAECFFGGAKQGEDCLLSIPSSEPVSIASALPPPEHTIIHPSKHGLQLKLASAAHLGWTPTGELLELRVRKETVDEENKTSRTNDSEELNLRRSARTRRGNLSTLSNTSQPSKVLSDIEKPSIMSNNTAQYKRATGALRILALLRKLGEGLLLLCQYRCKEAVLCLRGLSSRQLNTGWVMHMLGKANFEMSQYRQALEHFNVMRQVSPARSAGLEVFSTNLWHLKEEVSLCYLAQQAADMDKLRPENWCVLGNCFSLQKEHDVALKFFQRAIQLNPNFTYAYTLSGHEYVSNEDFEKAVSCYRHAIRQDPRHYNAWYGLGTIYYRQEKYDLAEYHFRRALAINSRSSVLYCYLGMVLHASSKCQQALDMLEKATELEPMNPQARFQRASVLRTMECYEASLEELKAVRDSAPREASVHFLMGKLCKQLGRKDDAMRHFTTALDLDPKDSNMIKVSIDKLHSNDIDEDDDL